MINYHPVLSDNEKNQYGNDDIRIHINFRSTCNEICTQEIDLLMSVWDELAEAISLIEEPLINSKLSQTETLH